MHFGRTYESLIEFCDGNDLTADDCSRLDEELQPTTHLLLIAYPVLSEFTSQLFFLSLNHHIHQWKVDGGQNQSRR